MKEDRTNTQKLITLHVDPELFAAAEKARGRVNRSQWVRDAIAEKAAREGFEVKDEAILPPDRARKGGSTWKPETLRKSAANNITAIPETPAKVAQDSATAIPIPARKRVTYSQKTPRKKAK